MVFVIVPGFLLGVITISPRLLADGTGGVFMEPLATELGATVAHAHGFGVTALVQDWSPSVELGNLGRAGEASMIGAESPQQPRTQSWAGAGEAAKDGCIGVLVH